MTAEEFLKENGFENMIAPKPFEAAAKELGMDFTKLLRFITIMYMGGQNQKMLRDYVLNK